MGRTLLRTITALLEVTSSGLTQWVILSAAYPLQKYAVTINSITPKPTYFNEVTTPLGKPSLKTGSEHLIGLKVNLQPKQRALSLNKLIDTIGLSKM